MNGKLADFGKLDPKPVAGKRQNNSNCMHTFTPIDTGVHTPRKYQQHQYLRK